MTRDEFNEKFEVDDSNGNYLFKTTSCFKRHSIPREEQMDKKVRRFGGYEDWEESELQSRLAEVLAKGNKIRPDETLEEFIERCMEVEDLTDVKWLTRR